ncbi:Signal transduction histidine kinase [Gracilibacillus orientalis]|uniref:histidine kinase n=1 Tax=Gracilibacillus orientalis TaxID=334253 RepID=A0A1I4NAB3_9BACI|nr:sensor histidine kinase [Gracilibacillus orientalis]SFM12306.1 Signal transduction histidine kinase [Gracilibacillus orientalis]
MANSVLIVVICLLLTYIIYSRIRHARDLRHIAGQLADLVNQPSSHVLYYSTNEPALKILLVEINRLLQMKQESSITFSQKELAMKKMITNISHDLRTPLTVVLGLTETLLQDPAMDFKEKTRYLSLIHNKAQEIVQRINRFFELVRLESDDVDIALVQLDLSALCKENVLSFYQQVEAKGLNMDLQLLDRPVYALANKEALDRVLQNLLSNAIRYGDEGKVIGTKLRADEQFVYIEIWDRGKGISEPYKELVFERLYTKDKMEGKHNQGSGLGLAITKQLVEKMHGDIEITSTPFVKTSITVKLQRCQSS